MKPHEIKPDTKLCTIIGYNAQRGYMRKYFNKIMKYYDRNATAIALNISDAHFDYTMQNVAHSKVDKMMIEKEFQSKVLGYCDSLNGAAQRYGRVDFIEVVNEKVQGYCLDEDAKACFETPQFIDDQALYIAKLLLIANRWYGTPVDIDLIPELIGE